MTLEPGTGRRSWGARSGRSARLRGLGAVVVFVTVTWSSLAGVSATAQLHPPANFGPHSSANAHLLGVLSASGRPPRQVPLRFEGERPAVARTFDVFPTNGTAGAIVDASGSSFAPNAVVSFSFSNGSGSVPSLCRADNHGRFPGTTGTPCSFSIPALPHGSQLLRATPTSWGTLRSGVPVDSGPWQSAYDAGTHEMFVAALNRGTVDVIADSNHTVVDRITVGDWPLAVAVDPGRSEVYVVNFDSSNVSVISDVTDRVVSSVRVGGDPDAIAFDSALDEMLVANYYNGTVSVISDSTRTVVATVGVGADPSAEQYDPATGRMYVANLGSANVSVVDDRTNSVVSSIAEGRWPYGLTLDPAAGQIFEVNEQADNVSVISTSNNTVVATIPLPAASYPVGTAYDPRTDQVFVDDYGGSNVSVISPVTDAIVGKVAVGSKPISITYDNGTGDLYVSNWNSNNESIIPTRNTTETGIFWVNSSLGFSTGAGSGVDAGQEIQLNGAGFGSGVAVATLTLNSTSMACVAATIGTCVSGNLTTAANGSFSATVVTPPISVSGSFPAVAVDSAGNRASVEVPVDADPMVSGPRSTPASIDVGQSLSISVVASSGSGSYRYVWSGLPSGCAGSGASIDCRPAKAGNYSVSVNVTDSNGVPVASGIDRFSVFSDPVVEGIRSSSATGRVDANQSLTFTAVVGLGSGTYIAVDWSGLPAGCAGDQVTVTCSGAALPAGTYVVSATVTDSNNFTSLAGPGISFSVDSDPLAGSPQAGRTTADVGQSDAIGTSVAGGSGSYSFAWFGTPAGCTGVATPRLECTFEAAGTPEVYEVVTDSNGFASTSPFLDLSIFADPSVVVSANRTTLDAHQSVTFTATVQFGSGGTTYAWSGLPAGCGGTGPVVQCSPSAGGLPRVSVTVTDSNGGSGSAYLAPLDVAPDLQGSISASSDNVSVGEPTSFTAEFTRGTGAPTYAWSFGDGGTAVGPSTSHTYWATGSFTVTLRANDSVGGVSVSRLQVVVEPAGPAAASGPTSPFSWVWVALPGLAVVGLVAVVLAIRRSSGRTVRPDPPTPSEPEPELPLYGVPPTSDPDDGPES